MASSRLSDIKILLVDDEKQIVRLVTDVLTHLGFDSITTASTGAQAAELLRRTRYDFMITDWRMPEMQGIDLIRFVRTSPECKCPRMPVIMLSGNTEAHYILTARDAGVNEYVIKPFSANDLVRRIRAIIETPRSYVEAPRYRGPNRRWHDVPLMYEADRRKRRAA